MSINCQAKQKFMEDELKDIKKGGVKLNLLLNANCYGAKALSEELENNVIKIIDYLFTNIGLDIVTTTSLFLAKRIKANFPLLEIRASVNMETASVSAMRYVKEYFDSFYLARRLNRYPEAIEPLKTWCEANNKKLFLLANSGCLRECSAHNFHDNLVSHEHEIKNHKNIWQGFMGVCWDYFCNPENHYRFIADSNWLRPEDIDEYSGLVDGIKLATRVHMMPEKVIAAYAQRNFEGNTLSLLEPDFSSLRYIENSAFPNSWITQLSNLNNKKYDKCCQEIFTHVKR